MKMSLTYGTLSLRHTEFFIPGIPIFLDTTFYRYVDAQRFNFAKGTVVCNDFFITKSYVGNHFKNWSSKLTAFGYHKFV
jgi:hypothetical protein